MIPYGRQEITAEDIEAVTQVLRSDFLTQGPAVPAFERTVSQKVNARHAVAVNSATSALHIACAALGLGAGDRLWTTPITFVASANCARYCGADVDFVDIDPRTYNLSPKALEAKLVEARSRNALPKIVVPVHLCGQPCDMEAIHDLSRQYGFRIIEDASHAIGARYHDEPIGSGRYCDVTVFSFHPVKIVTTGEGGMAVTNDDELARRMGLLRSHGITRDSAQMTQAPEGPWYYEQIELGYNYRMTDIQAALGISQMNRLDDYVARRHALARRYDELLRQLPLITPWQLPSTYSGLHLYVIRIATRDQNAPRRNHKQIFEGLRAAGIGVNVHYIPVHTQPYYQKMGFARGDFPEAERYYDEAISLPMYPTLREAEQDWVVQVLRDLLGA